MIHRCRPDFHMPALVEAVGGGPSVPPSERQRLETFASRRVFLIPSAREGLLWFLNRAGIGAGDEVAVPALLCEVVVDSLLASGARPVTYGVEEGTFGPSVAYCEAALSDRTRAVIVPHLFGIPADLKAFRALCAARGCLLIEDCAPCVYGESGREAVGSLGDCSLYSFKYDKPLSLGWGGAITLSPEMLARCGPPKFPSVSPEEDRLIAASFLLQHFLTESSRYVEFLGVEFALEFLLEHRDLAGEVMGLFQACTVASEVSRWWGARAPATPRHRTGGVAGALRAGLRAVVPEGLRRRLRPADAAPPPGLTCRELGGRALLPSGVCEHLPAFQDVGIRGGLFAARRASIAQVYQKRLDAQKVVFPGTECSPAYWLRFPVALRGFTGDRNRLAARIRQETGVEVGSFNWGTPIHRVGRFEKVVRVGAGALETEALMRGLLNLPVHAEMSEAKAEAVGEALGRA